MHGCTDRHLSAYVTYETGYCTAGHKWFEVSKDVNSHDWIILTLFVEHGRAGACIGF